VLTSLRRALFPALALATAVSAAACTSSSPGSNAAAAATACRQASPGRGPAVGGQRPGNVRWSVALARCVKNSGQTWAGTGLTAPTTWVTPAPGGKLAVVVNGVVSLYSTATGAQLWRRSVAPAGGPAVVARLDASSSLLLIQLRTASGTRTTFLDLASGLPQGKLNVAVHGDPFLVGAHVVVSDAKNTLTGYDPATGTTQWHATVPDAPPAQAEINDGSTVYLNPEEVGSTQVPMSRIDRLDAATGRLLAPITLPKPLDFDLSAEGGNDFDQELLLLGISSPATQTVAVDPATRTVKWSYPGDVVAGPGLFTSSDQGGSDLVAISPANGRQVWSLLQPGLGTEGGPDALLATTGFLAAWSPAAADRWVVAGIRPDGGRAWTSPGFPTATFLANDASTVYVVSCTPWKDSQSGLCAQITLAAVAA
jgi:outer membrane protein assembly factor BamB